MNPKKNSQLLIIGAIIIAAAVIGGALILSGGPSKPGSSQAQAGQADAVQSGAVTQEGGVQIITVTASGGYFPRAIAAKAGVPTKLRIVSQDSYGCESSFFIPSLNIGKRLPPNGTTEIDLGTLASGQSILGTCSMGMYTFTIKAS
jgi:heme/copper-type cytochrome/quinol oxidase subunit 2